MSLYGRLPFEKRMKTLRSRPPRRASSDGTCRRACTLGAAEAARVGVNAVAARWA
jgi:hypothetical protein